MKILAIEKDNLAATAEAFKQLAEAEAKAAWELQQNGFIHEIYFRADENSAVLVLEAESIEQAEQQLQNLPLVKNKLIYFELIPLKAYPGYARLFK